MDGLNFIVMELLEGQTLKQTIAGKLLPLESVIDFGVQIAGAIDAAHAKGVVHRDIKPANIFVIKQRRVKVLDFGLAKLTQLPSNFDETGMTDRTEPGTVMGTSAICLPSRYAAWGSMAGQTSSPLARSSTRCWLVVALSRSRPQ